MRADIRMVGGGLGPGGRETAQCRSNDDSSAADRSEPRVTKEGPGGCPSLTRPRKGIKLQMLKRARKIRVPFVDDTDANNIRRDFAASFRRSRPRRLTSGLVFL